MDCSSKNFRSLLVTQFLGALNDNIFKLTVSLLALKLVSPDSGGALYLSLGGALFVLPFILFSPYAGYLADHFPKTRIIQATKILELIIMGLALWGLVIENLTFLLAILFLMGTQSALFSPCKYGVLPEMLEDDSLSKGNGYIQFWTFLAIIIGTAGAGQAMSFWGDELVKVGLLLIFVSGLGLAASLFLSETRRFNQTQKFEVNGFKVIVETLQEIKKDQNLFLAAIAICYFWFVGAFFQMNTLLYAKQILMVGDQGTSLLLFALALGVGLGSVGAGKASEGKIELGLIPLGAMGLTLFSLLLGLFRESLIFSSFLLLGLGVSGGFFIVPLHAYVQKASPPEFRGRYLAAISLLSNLSMLFCAFVFWALKDYLGVSSAILFLLIGVCSVGITMLIFKKLPESFLRCLNWILAHSFYRVKVLNTENIPEKGGALLVCNHVSYMDPPLVLASLGRPVRFLMFRALYDSKFLNPIAKSMKAIPVSYADSRDEIAKSLNTAREAVENGEIVCIFAEGGLTRLGQLLPFKKGFERIMKGLDAPIIPMHIDQIWGSIFSFKEGKFFWKRPQQMPYPVTISFGQAMPSSSSAFEVRLAVQELSAEAFKLRAESNKLLHVGFLRQAKRKLFSPCMVDSMGMKLSYLQALVGALALSKKFRKDLEGQKNVGVLLPTSIPASLTNLALLMTGQTPVNLNFTASEDSLASAKKQCEMKTVLTARKFLEKLKMDPTPDMVFLEDVMPSISRVDKLCCFFAALVLPKVLIQRFFFEGKVEPHDVATIIFSSGSTGEPKGVMLTHANVASNVQAVYDVFQLKKEDAVIGVLPFFHSFGFSGGLWLPLLSGVKVIYHASPLDAGIVGKITEKHRGTILLSTPTFLQSYIRKCKPEQFQSLRNVIVGAEKLKDRISDAFEEKFGIVPLEGYGATELSPFATLNIEDYREGRITQTGQKKGKIGHPIPGVAVKVVDPDSGAELREGQDGLLLIKGPNVMKGYLGQPEKTSEVIQDGWYVTGDIANIDLDGFVTITDRLSRFSKIGGEMVPHIKVEEAIHESLGQSEQMCAVTAVPDEKKGERLVALCTEDIDVDQVRAKLSESGFPSLWIPRSDDFHRIEELPVLGSGKLDLKALKGIAEKLNEL